jgi:hypothetical protein
LEETVTDGIFWTKLNFGKPESVQKINVMGLKFPNIAFIPSCILIISVSDPHQFFADPDLDPT